MSFPRPFYRVFSCRVARIARSGFSLFHREPQVERLLLRTDYSSVPLLVRIEAESRINNHSTSISSHVVRNTV